MTRDQRNRIRSGPALAAVIAIGLLVGYPLSTGPAMIFYELAGEPPFLGTFFDTIYWPLSALPKPILEPLIWWVDFWVGLVP